MKKLSLSLLLVPAWFACNSIPQFETAQGPEGSGSMGGEKGGTDTIDLGMGGQKGGGTGGTANVILDNPCDKLDCAEGQHCEISGATASCEDDTCASLKCENQVDRTCIEEADGSAYCKDIGCSSNLECETGEYCDTDAGICIGSVCSPSAASCDGQTLELCNTNGSQLQELFSCNTGPSGFVSQCVEGSGGEEFGCTCIDDWDCPEFTRCEATTRADGAFELLSKGPRIGVCVGTGKEPTCSLPTEPFRADNTDIEIQWGSAELGLGNGDVRETVAANPDTPYPSHVQVVMTPLVANLDDDNGDGYIDEKDIPEIIFLSFATANQFQNHGVLRAIHGGGPDKGKDYFASCGAGERWFAGNPNADPPIAAGIAVGDGNCTDAEADLDPTAGVAIGDLDYDGIPEIVVIGEASDELFIYNNRGELLLTYNPPHSSGGPNPYPALANLDGQGLAEIIVGDTVYGLAESGGVLSVDRFFHGGGFSGRNATSQGPVPCIADLTGDGRLEVIAGPEVYAFPDPEGETVQADCSDSDWCDGKLTSLFIAKTIGGVELPLDGFCAVADILGVDPSKAPGPDNPLDGRPDVAIISDAQIYVFDRTGQSYFETSLRDGSKATPKRGGGSPNVDDFDGDGFPEIGTAGELGYEVIDLQEATLGGACPAWDTPLDPDSSVNPNTPRTPSGSCMTDSDCAVAGTTCNELIGQCICLHNGWESKTIDDSSRVTGSSVFDFNGDGAAEVVYNDECKFRVYDGLAGTPLIQEWSESRTRIEYPIVADVDRDGNAEIVFATTTESRFCDNRDTIVDSDSGLKASETFNAGVEVWGDLNDLWVPARGIWNQHAYHVTNVTESGQIPMTEPENWVEQNGRLYNTYRSNPRNYGVAPDLVVGEVQYTSPDAQCGVLGTQLDMIALIRNDGDLLVGPDSVISFVGTWGGDTEALLNSDGSAVTVALGTSLDPRRSIYVTVTGYDPTHEGGNNRASLPDSITVRADATSLETECNDEGFGQDNNSLTVEVEASGARPDLTVAQIGAVCIGALGRVGVTIENQGTAPAVDVPVAFYSGDPDAGGVELQREQLTGQLAPGASATLDDVDLGIPTGRDVTIYAVVDPDNAYVECNDGNNSLSAAPIRCGVITIPR